MKVRIFRQFSRNASHFLITSAIAIASLGSPGALADDVECGGQVAKQEELPPSESLPTEAVEFQYEEDLCGWATHDSCYVFDPEVAVPYPRIATRTSCSFDQSIAAAAATACATAGISVEQIVEPFAMVGPHVSDSMKRVKEFQQWWQKMIAEAQNVQPATPGPPPESSISEGSPKALDTWREFGESIVERAVEPPFVVEEHIDRLALEEPVDVDPWGGSVLVADDSEFYLPLPDPPSIPDASVAQVGASPVIVSIDDTYWPYDLSARDLRVWSVFPLVTEPFCIRGRHDTQLSSDSWADLDQATTERIIELSTEESVDTPLVADQPADVVYEAPLIEGSADCLLDELVWQVTCAFDEHQDLKVWLRPHGIGQQIAEIAIRASRVAGTATERIAGLWPDAPPVVEAKPATAGQQLLARAGAIEAAEPLAEADVAVPAASIAEAATVIVR
jgi:hypothetical protein